MKNTVVMFAVAYVVWLVLTWPPGLADGAVGVPVAALVAYLTGDLFVQRPHLAGQGGRYVHLIVHYIPVLAWECFKANIDVALRVLNPALPIRPAIVKAPVTLKTDPGLTFLANSITLTPGTLTVDVDKEAGLMYVHCIAVPEEDRESLTQRIVGRFEPILKRVFE